MFIFVWNFVYEIVIFDVVDWIFECLIWLEIILFW